MAKKPPRSIWTELERRLAILQILYYARQRRNDVTAGASGLMLADCLDEDPLRLEKSVVWLRDQDFIEPGERKFLITNTGIDYLIDQLGPGRLPPMNPPTDPTDPSRVPRKPFPFAPDTAAALPLPLEEST